MPNLKQISKTISYCLRHHPEEFNLKLDDQGYCDIDKLIENINQKRKMNIDIETIKKIIETSEKKRFEIKDNKIRATYGHSKVKVKKEKENPPEKLYHGTSHKALNSILKQGLLPMKRQYVHLSADIKTAIVVGKRRDQKPVILKIDTKKAIQDKIQFYYGNDTTWLSEKIPKEYIEVIRQ